MKKFLFILSAAALLLTGCAKEKFNSGTEGGIVNATFTAQIQGNSVTKAVADNDGFGKNITRCILELYYGDELYVRKVADAADITAPDGNGGNGTVKFNNIQLVSNRTYNVLCWADAGEEYYKADALTDIEMTAVAYTANNDKRDAFFYSGTQKVAQQGETYNITLTRPFAQVNVITTDASVIKFSSLYPENVKMVYTAPTKFNLLSKELGEEKELTVTGNSYASFNASSAELTLGMDYFFAGTDKSALDIKFEASKTGETTVKHDFTNIPVQRNYRTNIKGALLTTVGQWTATINPIWTGDGTTDEDGDDPYLVNYYQTGSIAAANEALKTNNAVSIENPSDLGTAIVIPTEQDGKNVFIAITGATNGDIVVKQPQDGEGPATLGIESDSKTLDINLPKSHVDVNNGVNYDAINAKTGDNTLVIGKDVKVKKLTTTKGAVVINGQVEELSSNAVAQINISTAEGLMAYAAALNAKKYTAHYANLVADIDMTGKEWVPMSGSDSSLRGFDGEEHTISNLTTTESAGKYYGLFMSASFDIKNVTVKDAVLTYPSSANDQARAGVIVGWLFSGNVTNCHVDGATIKASQKIGGIVGNVEASTTNPMTISDCSVKNLTVSSNSNDLVYQAAGIVGYIQQVSALNITVKNCSVENITVNDAFTGSDNIGWHNHSFIGNIENTKENTVIALENNTVDAQLPVERTVYTTDYFGWAGNEEASAGKYKATITIDGEEWCPDYPVQIVGGAKYATLSAALAAATEGQTVQILKAGEYTVETLSTKAAVVEATVEGVVFNHTAAATSWVASCNGTTVKNVTWNVGNAHHQYFSNTNLENCTVNGLLCTHTTEKFKDCTFINEEGYNFWVYGNEYTEFDNCTFTCPGKNDGVAGCGSAINCYNEGAQAHTSVLVIKNCTFTAKEASNKYSAIYIKPETAFDIRITNSTCNDNFCTGAISGSKLWNLKSDREGTTVSVDGNMVYPFSMDADGNYSVSNVFGLKMAIKHWNALKVSGEKSITLADGTYNVSDMAIFQNYANKSLLIKAENKKQAVITPPTGSKQLIFVVAGMSKSYAGHITVDGIKFDFSNASNKTIESDVISISDAVGTNLPDDEKALYSGTYHYAHDITIKNCEIIGLGIDNEHSSVVRTENQNGYNVKVQNCVIDKVGYVLTSKITTLAEVSDCTITDSKCVINNSTDQTEYKIIGNTISTYNNYCVRVQYGPIEVKDNNFNITWTPETGEYPTKHEPGVIALINSTGNEATITGNTFNKATDTMYDVYCTTSWIVNGETIPAGTGKNF